MVVITGQVINLIFLALQMFRIIIPSGPKRYDYSESADDWVYSRDGRAMGELLNEELTEGFSRNVDLKVSRVSHLV